MGEGSKVGQQNPWCTADHGPVHILKCLVEEEGLRWRVRCDDRFCLSGEGIIIVCTFIVWTQFTVPTGIRSAHPRGLLWIARM
jgi:hypothetical protein